jgi:hypothetical protein
MAPWTTRMSCLWGRKKREDVREESNSEGTSSRALRVVGWTSVALGITALGLFVGHELRVRYKFNRRTPTDLYTHAGEELGAEFGMGI